MAPASSLSNSENLPNCIAVTAAVPTGTAHQYACQWAPFLKLTHLASVKF